MNSKNKIKCGICLRLIKKGETYWISGPWILCKECHTLFHGDKNSVLRPYQKKAIELASKRQKGIIKVSTGI